MVIDDRRPAGKPFEILLEGFAALLILIGCGGAMLIFVGLLFRAIVWSWSWVWL